MDEKKAKLLTAIMGATIFLLVVVIGTQFFVLMQLSASMSKSEVENEATHAKEEKTKISVEDTEAIKVVEKKIYTLAPDSQGNQYTTRLTISIGVNKKSKEFKEKVVLIEEKGPIVNDVLDSTIRSKTHDDLLKGETFFNELKNELIKKLNDKLDTDIIVGVYFDDVYSQISQ